MTQVSTKAATFAKGDWVNVVFFDGLEHGGYIMVEGAIVVSVGGDMVVVRRSSQLNTFAPDAVGEFVRVLPDGSTVTSTVLRKRRMPESGTGDEVKSSSGLSPMQRFFSRLGFPVNR